MIVNMFFYRRWIGWFSDRDVVARAQRVKKMTKLILDKSSWFYQIERL